MKIAEKVYQSPEELLPILDAERAKGGKIVVCHGTFDLIHNGHIAHLREARSYGDILVVGISTAERTSKGPGRPIFSDSQRLEHMAALEMVDYVALDHGLGDGFIRVLKPDVFVKGADYAEIPHALQVACEYAGTEMILTSALTDSSSRISARAFTTYPPTVESWLADFRSRHSVYEIMSALDAIKTLRVLVMTTRHEVESYKGYFLPNVPKEEFRSMHVVEKVDEIGVYELLRGQTAPFVGHVDLLTQRLPEQYIFYFDIKGNKPVFHVNLNAPGLEDGEEEAILWQLASTLSNYDVVIAADYDEYIFTPAVRDMLENEASFLALTVKSHCINFPWHDASRWNLEKVGLLECNNIEQRLGQNKGMGVPQNKLFTDGENGCYYNGIHIPSLAVEVVGLYGCGDSMLALAGPLASIGVDDEIVGFVASCAAAIHIREKFNCISLNQTVLRKFITRLLS